MKKHPMQPIAWVDDVIRFQENTIVNFLLDWSSERGMDLNKLATMRFSKNDWSQLAQLIGYSVSGYGGLSYAIPEVVAKADKKAAKLVKKREKKK